jgi:phosphoribosylglycinamide formyltransferase-1
MLNFVAQMQTQIIIFISGAGSNAREIIRYFDGNEAINVCGVVSSKENATMALFCEEQQVPFVNLEGQDFSAYLNFCLNQKAQWVILAGFLKKIPIDLLEAYPDRIINIHPSLLPNYGGAGMYGKKVHEAVAAAKESFSGISIHLVNEEFDKGKLLFQHAVKLPENASPEQIESSVRALELTHFAQDLETYLSSN